MCVGNGSMFSHPGALRNQIIDFDTWESILTLDSFRQSMLEYTMIGFSYFIWGIIDYPHAKSTIPTFFCWNRFCVIIIDVFVFIFCLVEWIIIIIFLFWCMYDVIWFINICNVFFGLVEWIIIYFDVGMWWFDLCIYAMFLIIEKYHIITLIILINQNLHKNT